LDGAEPPTALVEDVVGDYKKNITRYKHCLTLWLLWGRRPASPWRPRSLWR
jgi:hypothetical protein